MLDKYREGDGFVSYDTVTEPQRQELSRAIDALGKEVSQVQGAIAPSDTDQRRAVPSQAVRRRRVTAAVVGAAERRAPAGRASAATPPRAA